MPKSAALQKLLDIAGDDWDSSQASGCSVEFVLQYHRRRINTEEKATVVAAVWGTECIQFLAALAILHQDELKKRMNCTRLI